MKTQTAQNGLILNNLKLNNKTMFNFHEKTVKHFMEIFKLQILKYKSGYTKQ